LTGVVLFDRRWKGRDEDVCRPPDCQIESSIATEACRRPSAERLTTLLRKEIFARRARARGSHAAAGSGKILQYRELRRDEKRRSLRALSQAGDENASRRWVVASRNARLSLTK